jgi:hypothetical protein
MSTESLDKPTPHLSALTQKEVLNLLSILEGYLPYSLPLYRRLQFYLAHPGATEGPPHAQIFHTPTQCVDDDGIKSSLCGSNEASLQDECVDETWTKAGSPWLAAHVDLSRCGETQVWIFANWECSEQVDHRNNTKPPPPSPQELEARQVLLRSFFEFIYTKCVPLMPQNPPTSFTSVKKHHGNHHPYSPSAVLLGACNLAIRSLIPDSAIRRVDFPYLKYIFRSSTYEHAPSGSKPNARETLPPGYRYGALRQPQDLQLALDRTHIPRTVDTLALLPSRAVFYQDEPAPVAWGFLGIDASLTSLRTEPQHRGKNLAVLLAGELFNMQHEHFETRICEGSVNMRRGSLSEWGHADVGEDNSGSRRVMEKAGGEVWWKDCWVEVELERLFGAEGMWHGP